MEDKIDRYIGIMFIILGLSVSFAIVISAIIKIVQSI